MWHRDYPYLVSAAAISGLGCRLGCSCCDISILTLAENKHSGLWQAAVSCLVKALNITCPCVRMRESQ
ncbi:hypothetical protein PSYCG_10005 [Psychrobacter sp. G]|nr:hypothetical protein PSYCG_10005 [Psychrobacter sp. G]